MSETSIAKEQKENQRDASPTASSGGEQFVTDWRFYAAFLTMSLVTLVAALDATSISVALPIIARKLNGSAIEAFWSGTSFLLTATVLLPVFASLSNIFGRRNLILITLVFFTVGAIVAGVAKNFTVLLAGRSIQGIGGGGIIVLTEIIVTDLVPLRERGKWFGFISSMWALGSVSGPLIGGAFSLNVTWRWIFYLNLPFCGIAFVAIPAFIRLKNKKSTVAQKLARIDYVGIFLFIASTTSFLVPVTWGGVVYPWNSWHTLVPLILGACGIVGFCFWEALVPKEPLIPLSVFLDKTTNLTFIGTFFHGAILWCLLYYLPLYFEAVKGLNPILAGVAVFPESFTVAPMAIAVGIIVTVTGKYWWAMIAGWVFTTTGCGLNYLLGVERTTVEWVFLCLVAGIGTGMLFPSMAFSIQAAATDKNMALAVAMFGFFRVFGQAVGVAVGGVIFQNRMKVNLLKYPELASRASEYAQDAAALTEMIKHMPDGDMKLHLRTAFADSLKVVWAVMAGFAFLSLIAALFTKALPLDRALNTEQGYDRKQKEGDEELSKDKVAA